MQDAASPAGSSEGSGELVSIPMENGSAARRASIELEERQPLKLQAERRESGKHASSSQVLVYRIRAAAWPCLVCLSGKGVGLPSASRDC